MPETVSTWNRPVNACFVTVVFSAFNSVVAAAPRTVRAAVAVVAPVPPRDTGRVPEVISAALCLWLGTAWAAALPSPSKPTTWPAVPVMVFCLVCSSRLTPFWALLTCWLR